jgi:uncharacterized repeat protein (TIGR01451 family)
MMRFRSKSVVLLLAVFILFAAREASANWADGALTYTETPNCVSVIQGKPYIENLTMESVGYGGNFTLPPKVGEIYYARLMVGTPGNPCAGPYVHVELGLPKNTEFAVDAAHPIECWMQNPTADPPRPYAQITDGSCPTQPSLGFYGSGFYSFDTSPVGSWEGGPWPLATGATLYLYVPVITRAPLGGMADTGAMLVGAIRAIEGDMNPWDGPQYGWNGLSAPSSGPYQWITVLNNPASVAYAATTGITASTAHVSGTLTHHAAKGSVYVDMGTTAGYGYTLGPFSAPVADTAPITADYTGLTSGTTYHWRIRFVRVDGVITYGADQTFTTTGTTVVALPTYGLAVSGNSLWHLESTTSDLGAHYTLTAIIDTPGYFFKSWRIDNGAITSTSNPYVLTMNDNHFVEAILGFNEADLQVTASASPDTIVPAGQVTYAVTVRNNGTANTNATPMATEVVLTNILPAGMTYISSSVTGTTCTEASGAITCNLGSIDNLQSKLVTIVAQASVMLPGSASMKTTVTSTAYDGVTANNTATVSTVISAGYSVAPGKNTPAVSSSAQVSAQNVPIIQLVTMATGTENVKINSVTIQASGTGNDALDISAVKLYLDVNGNGVVDSGDTQLSSGTFSADNGSLNLPLGTALTVMSGTPQNLLVTYDFSPTLASTLTFAGVPLVFVGFLGSRRSRRWMILTTIGIAMLCFSACGGGGGGGEDAVPPGTSASRTYHLTVSAMAMQGAISNSAITVNGMPTEGTTVTVNK